MILDKYKISHEDFHSKKRDAYIVKGRHLYMFILRKIYEIPLLMCGKLTSRNHASVLHACKTIQDAYDVDKRFKKEFITIINKIYANEYKHIHSSQRPEEIS
jgi:chromosomal replication initiator protein